MTDVDRLLIGVALACMWIGGYATGRGRPARALVAWADWHYTIAPRSDPRFWIAAPIVAAAVCCLWAFRPRRSWRNWRAWHHRDRQRALPTHTPSRLSDRRTPKEGHPQ